MDFRYAINMSAVYGPGTPEYDFLSTLDQDTWVLYLDAHAATGVTIEYDLQDDVFRVRGHQADTDEDN